MIKRDYLMRKISNLIRFVAKILFNKEIISYEETSEKEFLETDTIYIRLIKLIDDKKINEAENLLFEKFNPENDKFILLALDFYQRLNNLDDEVLEETDFSKEEIYEGLKDIIELVGIKNLDI